MVYKRDKLRNLFIINPMILNKKKRYIWISEDKEDIESMACSLNYCIFHNIYFNGFVTNCLSIVGITMLNKRVYDVKTIIDGDSLILTENECNQYFCPVEILNPALNLSHIVVWGAGYNGKSLVKYLEKRNISIDYFIDSNKDKVGDTINGIKVYGAEHIRELTSEISLIEASDKYAEIDKIVTENVANIDCYVYDHADRDKCFTPHWIMYLREVLQNKNVYIYGYNHAAIQCSHCLHIFDYHFAGFLVEETQYDEICGYEDRISLPEEILYCQNYFIIVMSDNKEMSVKRLQALGLQYSVDFSPIGTMSYNLLYARKNIIDPNLGHTYKQKTGMNGMEIYGKETSNNYKIVILGGSTSDGKLFPFKCWPQIMYEKINNEKVVVYNGGVSGYTSAQELIKLIRDIVLLNPDVIIVYDGYNDTNETNACPGKYYEFIYLMKALDFAMNHMNHDWDFISQEDDEESGSSFPVLGNFENWLLNIELMHAIAIDRGIKFYSFLQPMLSSKKNLSKEEAGILFVVENFMGLQQTSEVGKEFREKIENVLYTHDYIHDLSHIFDDVPNVYMDICHVRESANRIIAAEILKRIEIPS